MYFVFTGDGEIPNVVNITRNKIAILTNPPLTLKRLYFSVFESKVYNFICWFSLILRYNKAKAYCKQT